MAVDLIARGLAASAKKKADAAPSHADLDKKLDKVTAGSANPQLYGVSESGEQTMYFATQTANANTVPMRDASGRFQVADGVAPKQAVNKEQLDAKIDVTGGTFTGNVAIQGDLTVSGTTTTENEKQLAVEENVIVTNSKKVALQTLLSGLAINKDANATYGIMYDPADDTVKFGEGTLDKDRKFVFNTSEGKPIAVRADAADFTDTHLVRWDAATNSFVDADTTVEDFAQLKEQNSFSGLNTFQEDTQFNKGLNSDGDVAVTNAVLKVMNNTDNVDGTNKDYVAQYDADKISIEENGTNYVLNFPKKSGTFATLSDVAGSSVPFNYSEFTTENVLETKEDGWRLNDDTAHISIYHQNTTTQSGLSISKNHIGIQATEEEGVGTNAAVLAMSSDTISMYVTDSDGETSTNLTLQKNSATLNNVAIATVTDLEGKLNVLEQSAVNQVYAKTENGNEGISFSYSAEGNTIAKRSAAGTLAVETPTQDNDAANKKFVETQCANIPVGVQISDVAGSTSGVLAEDDFAKLQANANNYILKDGKKYERSSDRSTEDSLTYVYNGYLSNRQLQEAIEITVSAQSWVLNSDKLLTDKTIANGKIGGVSVKSDFVDGLEVAQSDGNLSIYGALDADIASRASKRPITPTNLNKAIIAALSDANKAQPDDNQISEFKATWGITSSIFDIGLRVIELTPASATSGTLSQEDYDELNNNKDICLKLNNEYYYLADDGHTEGIITYTHSGWNGSANQAKSINITASTKAWTLVIGKNSYYRHYIKLTVGDKTVSYDFLSARGTSYTQDTLPVMPDDVSTSFIVIVNNYYSSVNGQVYRSGDGTLKVIIHGLYTTNGTDVSYLAITGDEAVLASDTTIEI